MAMGLHIVPKAPSENRLLEDTDTSNNISVEGFAARYKNEASADEDDIVEEDSAKSPDTLGAASPIVQKRCPKPTRKTSYL